MGIATRNICEGLKKPASQDVRRKRVSLMMKANLREGEGGKLLHSCIEMQ